MCLQPRLFSCAESSPNRNAEIAEVQKSFLRSQKCHPEPPRDATSLVLLNGVYARGEGSAPLLLRGRTL